MNINNVEITEETMKERGILPLTAAEIEKTIIGKTIKGDWANERKYVCYMNPRGAAEGENDLGTHAIGKWFINKKNNTFSVEWESYWDKWCGRVYNIEEKIVLFDEQTNKMRTSIHTIEDGRRELKL
jgi:hypothetical protein